ncbi:MAG: C39 family peptidase, partial [Chloroflexota bacterium]
MSKQIRTYLYLLAFVIGVGLLALWFLLPTILRAIPSRYVVRLPEPLQAIGQRDHVEILPTAEVQEALIAQILPTSLPTVAPTLPPVSIVELSTAVPTPAGEDPSAVTSADSEPAASPTPPPTSTPLPTPTITPTPSPTPLPFSPSARIEGIQHHFQGWNNCGPATISMALSYYDLFLTQDVPANWLKPNPEDRNVSPHELVAFVESETPFRGIDRVNGDLDTLKRLVDNKIPVIIETGIDPPGTFSWMEWYGHYYLVVAYDDESETMWVYDSWLGTGEGEDGLRINEREGRPISYEAFDFHWRQFIRQYVAVYPEEKESLVHDIIGRENLDDQVMWSKALEQA